MEKMTYKIISQGTDRGTNWMLVKVLSGPDKGKDVCYRELRCSHCGLMQYVKDGESVHPHHGQSPARTRK